MSINLKSNPILMLVILGVSGIIGSQVGSLVYNMNKPKSTLPAANSVAVPDSISNIKKPDFSNVPKVDMPSVSKIMENVKIPVVTDNKPIVINDTFIPTPTSPNSSSKTIVNSTRLTSPVSGPEANWFTLKDEKGNQYNFKQIQGAETSKFYSNGIDSDVLFSGEVEEVTIDKTQFPEINYKVYNVKSVTQFNKVN